MAPTVVVEVISEVVSDKGTSFIVINSESFSKSEVFVGIVGLLSKSSYFPENATWLKSDNI